MIRDPEILEALLDSVRRFVREVLVPAEHRLEEEDRIPPEIVRGMADLGLFGIAIPEEFGGLGLSTRTQLVAIEEVARTDAARCNPLDEYLPSAGLPANDLGYIVVRGPAMCLTSLTNMTAHVNKGDTVVCQTAATSGATNAITGAGRINSGDLTGATSVLANQILNHFVAMSGISSGSTNTDMLVFVKG